MPKCEYDTLADAYAQDVDRRPDRTAILVPTARRYAGELAGRTVLDLACGGGYFTRLLKVWGAKRVVGIDLSEKMLALARREEDARPLGIEYWQADARTLEAIDSFDLAFAAFLLHYAASPAELTAMCRAIAANLKPGGRLVAFNQNPFHPLHDGVQYDATVEALGPVKDGVEMVRTHFENGTEVFRFSHYHYEPGTYEAALREAGFSEIRWQPFVRGVTADRTFPAGYWDTFTGDSFSVRVLTATR